VTGDKDWPDPESARRGAALPRLQLVALIGDQVRTFDLPSAGKVIIGRGEGNGVRIDDPSVSRQHAALHIALEIDPRRTAAVERHRDEHDLALAREANEMSAARIARLARIRQRDGRFEQRHQLRRFGEEQQRHRDRYQFS